MGIVEVLEISGGRSPLIIEDLDVYPQLPRTTGATTLNSEEPDIEWLAARGIVTGYPDGTYRPLQPVTRDAMCAFLSRSLSDLSSEAVPDPGWTDFHAGDQFFADAAALAAAGIVRGWPDRTFRPLQPVARDAMAAFLYRAAGSPSFAMPTRPSFTDVPLTNQFSREIEWMRAAGISTGWSDGTYRPLQPVARDAMAAFLRRAHPLLDR